LEPLDLSVLCAAAFATSILSGVVGMAGGSALLVVLLLFFDPLVAIPLLGVIQLVSNGARTVIQRRHVEWPMVSRFGVLLLPMGFIGLYFAQLMPPSGARLLIGAFVLAVTWVPGGVLLGAKLERFDPGRRMWALGAVVGVLNTTIGATGPLLAPFFLDIGLTRQAVIGTKAACQILVHLAKIVVFGAAGFAFHAFALPLLLLSAIVVVGTWIGSRILDRVDEIWFVRLYRAVLTIIALRLVVWDGLAALGIGS
jgi:uncharacterized membrane protein YfcA